MGKKYASIHIINQNPDALTITLLEHYKQHPTYSESIMTAAQYIDNTELLKFTERYLELEHNDVLILQSTELVSIYDPALSFETIEEKVRIFAKMITDPIVYISNFNYDVLIFGIFNSSKLITAGVIGEGLAAYGLSLKMIDVKLLTDNMKIYDSEFCDVLCTSHDISIVESEFERILNIHLSLTIEDIESDQCPYDVMLNESGIRVHKKKLL